MVRKSTDSAGEGVNPSKNVSIRHERVSINHDRAIYSLRKLGSVTEKRDRNSEHRNPVNAEWWPEFRYLIVGTCRPLRLPAVHGHETYRSVTKSVGNRETFHVSDGRSIAVS